MFFLCADLSEACLTSKTSQVVKVCDGKESRFSSSHSPPHSTVDLQCQSYRENDQKIQQGCFPSLFIKYERNDTRPGADTSTTV